MTREIKFRAWDKDMKEWIPEKSIIISKGKPLALINEVPTPIEKAINMIGKLCNPNWELIQFTGLKDKNGKEIYEGDIINFWANDTKQVVEFKNGAYWMFVVDDDHNPVPLPSKYIEVIGNIYENPELLKGD